LREYHVLSIIEAIIWSFKCVVGDIVRCRKNKNILIEIILKKCVFNALWYVSGVFMNYAPNLQGHKCNHILCNDISYFSLKNIILDHKHK